MSSLHSLSPDLSVLLFSIGISLVFLELNRPGFIVPGSLGLLLGLLAIASLSRWRISGWAMLLLLAGISVPLWQLRRKVSLLASSLSVVAIPWGLTLLVHGPGSARVHVLTATLCGIPLAGAASALAHVAHRARGNKGLN